MFYLVVLLGVKERNIGFAVSDDTSKAEGIGHFFKFKGKASARTSKKLTETLKKKLGRSIERGAEMLVQWYSNILK